MIFLFLLDFGVDRLEVVSELKQVEAICASSGAFAALKRDGTVTTWGDKGQRCVM